AGRAIGMFAASATRQTSPGEFVTPTGTRMETQHEGVVAYLTRCISAFPSAIPIDAADAEMAVALFQRGLIDIRTVPGAATRAGGQPLASPLARYQAARGSAVSTLLHTVIQMTDAETRGFLGLLNGTRDRDALAREFGCSLEQVDVAL